MPPVDGVPALNLTNPALPELQPVYPSFLEPEEDPTPVMPASDPWVAVDNNLATLASTAAGNPEPADIDLHPHNNPDWEAEPIYDVIPDDDSCPSAVDHVEEVETVDNSLQADTARTRNSTSRDEESLSTDGLALLSSAAAQHRRLSGLGVGVIDLTDPGCPPETGEPMQMESTRVSNHSHPAHTSQHSNPSHTANATVHANPNHPTNLTAHSAVPNHPASHPANPDHLRDTSNSANSVPRRPTAYLQSRGLRIPVSCKVFVEFKLLII